MTHWRLDVDRGPGWIFVRIHPPRVNGFDAQEHEPGELAERIWDVLLLNHCYRVVLEMDAIDLIMSALLGQLVQLSKRVHSHDGILRISGLSLTNQDILRTCRLDSALPHFQNREHAVMGYRPLQPR